MHISADNRLNTTHSVDKKNKARDEQYPLDLANHREITKDSLLIYTIRTTGLFSLLGHPRVYFIKYNSISGVGRKSSSMMLGLFWQTLGRQSHVDQG